MTQSINILDLVCTRPSATTDLIDMQMRQSSYQPLIVTSDAALCSLYSGTRKVYRVVDGAARFKSAVMTVKLAALRCEIVSAEAAMAMDHIRQSCTKCPKAGCFCSLKAIYDYTVVVSKGAKSIADQIDAQVLEGYISVKSGFRVPNALKNLDCSTRGCDLAGEKPSHVVGCPLYVKKYPRCWTHDIAVDDYGICAKDGRVHTPSEIVYSEGVRCNLLGAQSGRISGSLPLLPAHKDAPCNGTACSYNVDTNRHVHSIDCRKYLPALIPSALRVPVSLVEYRKALKKLWHNDPSSTVASLAAHLGKSPKWINDVLNCNGTYCTFLGVGDNMSHAPDCWHVKVRLIDCTGCGMKIDPTMTEGTKLCGKCALPDTDCSFKGCKHESGDTSEYCKEHATPKSRGLRLCLEPKCKTWISKRRYAFDSSEANHFCKKHKRNTFESFPLMDRDGDPIWVGAGFRVLKMSNMEMSHVLNCISMLEKNAEKRVLISVDQHRVKEAEIQAGKEKFLAETPRYALLIAEVKQRDACKLCKDGIERLEYAQIMGIDGCLTEDISEAPNVIYCSCERGKVRELATLVREQASKNKVTVTLGVVFAMVTALLLGASTSNYGARLVHAVAEQLRHMGML